jgi:hypothetical protein
MKNIKERFFSYRFYFEKTLTKEFLGIFLTDRFRRLFASIFLILLMNILRLLNKNWRGNGTG